MKTETSKNGRRLGGTELMVSPLTLGTWAFAGGKMWGEQAEAASIRTVHAALDWGLTTFDSAPGYGDGEAERVLGKALEGRREQAVIATKVSRADLSATDLMRSCDRSLELLRTDFIDLLQVHWANHDIPFEETAAGLMKLKEQGKVRHIGVCNFGPVDLEAWRATGAEIVSNQLPYSLLTRSIEVEIVPLCQENEISILAYSPLMQGLLTGKFQSPDDVPEARRRSRHFRADRPMARHGEPGCEAETFAAIEAIRRVAERLSRRMEQVALAWILQKPGIASAIVGARNEEQVEQNLAAVSAELTAEVMEELDKLTDDVKHHMGKNPDIWESPSRFR